MSCACASRTARLPNAGWWCAAVGACACRCTRGRSWPAGRSWWCRPDTLLLTGSRDKTAVLWEADSGRELRAFRGHAYEVEAVAFSPDGKRILTGSGDTAALWEADSGRPIRTFQGASGDRVRAVAFSPDGKRVLTGSSSSAVLWEADSGRRLRTFQGHTRQTVAAVPDAPPDVANRTPEGHTDDVTAVAFSPDGKRILTGSSDKTAMLWEADSGRKTRSFKGHTKGVTAATFSPDGKRVLTGSDDETAALWEADSGRKIRSFQGHTGFVSAVAFSPDGKQVLTGSWDKTAVLWEAGSARQIRPYEGHKRGVTAVAFSPDGKQVLTGSFDHTAGLWETDSARQVRSFQGHTSGVSAVAFGPDGKHVLTGLKDGVAALWDAESGRQTRTSKGHFDAVVAVAFSPDGKQVLTGSWDKTAIVWEAQSGRRIRTFQGHPPGVVAVAFSPDGKHVLANSRGKTAALWEAGNGRQIRTFQGHRDAVSAVAFSPDGKLILTGSHDTTAALWEADSGRKVRSFEGHFNRISPGSVGSFRPGWVHAAAFSPDGQRILTGSQDETAVLWEADSGRKLHVFRHSGAVRAVCFSPDGKLVLTASENKTAALWDAESGRQIRILQGHTDAVNAVAFRSDGKRVLTASEDGTARLWDVATGDELARLLTLDGGTDWLVVNPEGLFDGSLGGREKVAFRIGNGLTALPVERFFQDFHHPGLLAELFKGQRPAPEATQRLQQPPLVHIVRPQRGGTIAEPEATLEVEAIDQGDGVRGPWLLHNGARVLAPGEASREGKTIRRRFRVSLVQGDNRLLVQAASAAGSPESEPAVITLRYEKPLARPDLYVLAVGVNRYKQEAMNLKFAAADARAFADLFRRRGKGGLYADVHPTTLLDDKATRAGLRKELEAIAKQARPQDTLLVFLAGHGSTLGQRYFFIPHEFSRTEGKTLEEDVRKQGVPGDELADHLGAVPALKRVLVLDTCQSGGALALRRGRDPFALRGAVERLSRSQGVFTIAAAAAGEEAQEVQELGHGVLTYALLAGLRAVEGGPLEGKEWIKPNNPERVADVLEWFSFASGQVPRLTRKYFGREQDVQSSGQGNSFPLLPVEEK
jgi:WD40 repeat protein